MTSRQHTLQASRVVARLACGLAVLVAPPAPAAGPAAGLAYVSNQQGDVSVIDLATLAVTGTVSPYGKEPRGIGITADGRRLVIANRDGGRVAVVERATGRLLRQVVVGSNPEFVRVRGHLAFVSYEPSSTGKPPAAAASGATHDGEAAHEPAHEPAHIAVVDIDRGRVLRSITGGLETEGIEFSADGRHVLITNEADNSVTVHEIATGRLVKAVDTTPWGRRPRGIKMAPDGQSYVVTLESSDALIVLDARYDVVKAVKTAGAPYGVAFDRPGKRLFVAAARSRVLQVFDARSYAPVKDVPTGARCWHFTFTPDETKLLVACGRSGEIVVIDAATLEPVKRIADDRMPWGIVTWPRSSGSLDRTE